MAKVLLSEWARRNKVRPRTAVSWAQNGRIKAMKGRLKIVLTQTKTVHGYLVNENTPLPGDDKAKSSAKVARQPKQA